MKTRDGFAGLCCLDCAGTTEDAKTRRCPDCGGPLEPTYDEGTLAQFHERLDGSLDRRAGLGRFAPVLPFERDQLVTIGEGATPLLECPTLASAWGVDRVLYKDEGRNATGALVDRGLALAVTAASQQGADDVALPTTGAGGQAVAAYAARAGLSSHSFVPSRTEFDNKAMINVHGGEMNVVGGRYPDAHEAFQEDRDSSWYSLAPFETPYRHEGCKTLAYELVAELGGAPDAVVHPTGHGIGLVGIDRGFREFARTGAIEHRPRLYAAQPAGCAPIVGAWSAGEDEHDPVEHPDTICGSLEIPDPAGGRPVLDALAESDGGAIEATDDESLEAAVSLCQAGVPASATGGVAVSGGHTLSERGAFESDSTVVVVDPTTANREADILRSHLMKQGI